MKIYVSGTFTAQNRLRGEADNLRSLGHHITSTWLYEAEKPAHMNPEEWNLALADKDIAELFSSDLIILDRDGASTTGGRYVEWGVACAPGSMLLRWTVGGPDQFGVFDTKAHVHFENWIALFQQLVSK